MTDVAFIPNNKLETLTTFKLTQVNWVTGLTVEHSVSGTSVLGINRFCRMTGDLYLGGALKQASGTDILKERPVFAKVGANEWVY